MKFEVGDVVKIENDAPLSGNTVAPPVVIGDRHEIEHIILDKKGNQHIDIGLKSEYGFIRSWETDEELPEGDKVHWVHPTRLKLISRQIN